MNIKYSDTKIIPGILAWFFMTLAYYYIVQHPVEDKYLRGLIFSIGLYGLYNFTNLAVLQDYSYELAIRDTTWGIILIAIVTLISSFLPNNL
jgi:uncharacterized membrane protein